MFIEDKWECVCVCVCTKSSLLPSLSLALSLSQSRTKKVTEHCVYWCVLMCVCVSLAAEGSCSVLRFILGMSDEAIFSYRTPVCSARWYPPTLTQTCLECTFVYVCTYTSVSNEWVLLTHISLLSFFVPKNEPAPLLGKPVNSRITASKTAFAQQLIHH